MYTAKPYFAAIGTSIVRTEMLHSKQKEKKMYQKQCTGKRKKERKTQFISQSK